MFQPGQKVVCVDATFHPLIAKHLTAMPEKDKVYVVRGIAPGRNPYTGEEDIAVYLVGLVNPTSTTPPHRERGFAPERFVPLQELPPEKTFAQKVIEDYCHALD